MCIHAWEPFPSWWCSRGSFGSWLYRRPKSWTCWWGLSCRVSQEGCITTEITVALSETTSLQFFFGSALVWKVVSLSSLTCYWADFCFFLIRNFNFSCMLILRFSKNVCLLCAYLVVDAPYRGLNWCLLFWWITVRFLVYFNCKFSGWRNSLLEVYSCST